MWGLDKMRAQLFFTNPRSGSIPSIRPPICLSICPSSTLFGRLVCVIYNSKSFHYFIFKLCIMIVHTLKMCTTNFWVVLNWDIFPSKMLRWCPVLCNLQLQHVSPFYIQTLQNDCSDIEDVHLFILCTFDKFFSFFFFYFFYFIYFIFFFGGGGLLNLDSFPSKMLLCNLYLQCLIQRGFRGFTWIRLCLLFCNILLIRNSCFHFGLSETKLFQCLIHGFF